MANSLLQSKAIKTSGTFKLIYCIGPSVLATICRRQEVACAWERRTAGHGGATNRCTWQAKDSSFTLCSCHMAKQTVKLQPLELFASCMHFASTLGLLQYLIPLHLEQQQHQQGREGADGRPQGPHSHSGHSQHACTALAVPGPASVRRH